MTLVALDLDRTVIYSASAVALSEPAVAVEDLRVVEVHRGVPSAWMTHRSWALLGDLMQRARVVPVTTRDLEQYGRVTLPVVPEVALCANGAVRLLHGRVDDGWARPSAPAGRPPTAPLAAAFALLQEVAREPWVSRTATVADAFCYLAATDRTAISAPWTTELAARCEPLGWSVSVQGRKVYLLPAGLTKAAAVEALRLSAGEPLLAAGDSLLDAELLERADAAIRPAHGELHDRDWHRPGLAVTSAPGVHAGEEILAWLLDHPLVAGEARRGQLTRP